MTKQKLKFRDAFDLVPDDLPDGAFWAMAHEMAGLEYGEGFDGIDDDEFDDEAPLKHHCDCGKRFTSKQALYQHRRDSPKHKESTP